MMPRINGDALPANRQSRAKTVHMAFRTCPSATTRSRYRRDRRSLLIAAAAAGAGSPWRGSAIAGRQPATPDLVDGDGMTVGRDGKRFIDGEGRFPAVRAIDQPLAAARWIVAAPSGSGAAL
jgi:hypothetical protein